MTGQAAVFVAAPLDGRARALLVGWLTAWFALVGGLLTWSVLGGGLGVLMAAVVAGTLLPAAVLFRLAGFPSAYVLAGDALTVRRHLLPDRAFAVARPVARDDRATELRRRGALAGAAYGCRWMAWPTPGGRERLYVAATDLERAVRVGIEGGAALVTPADPKGFLRAARAAAQA